MRRWFAGFAFLLLSLPASAQGLVDVTVHGNELRAGVSLPGGIGADLSISFEQVEGLSLENLGLSAQLVSLLDPNLLSRLSGASIPAAFPMLLRIEPPAGGGLTFHGVATIDLHTHNLPFLPGCPLRIFAASLGGPFQDITVSMGIGSYRARGRKGDFSEFLILVDLRPVNRVINEKLGRLDGILAANEAEIAPAVHDELTRLAAEIRAAHTAGRTREAITKVEAFLAVVESHSGSEIPDVWRSARDLVNVAGRLQAAGETLRFSLSLKANQSLLGLL
jgi:hypothetical protein